MTKFTTTAFELTPEIEATLQRRYLVLITPSYDESCCYVGKHTRTGVRILSAPLRHIIQLEEWLEEN